MAYDLAYRRLTPRDYARDSTAPRDPRSELGQLGVLALVVLLPVLPWVLPWAIHVADNYRLRRVLRPDRAGRQLRSTAELPAVTMRELVYGSEEEGT